MWDYVLQLTLNFIKAAGACFKAASSVPPAAAAAADTTALNATIAPTNQAQTVSELIQTVWSVTDRLCSWIEG